MKTRLITIVVAAALATGVVLVVDVPSSAQVASYPSLGSFPLPVPIPASAVNGAGVVTSPQLLWPNGTQSLPGGAFQTEPATGFYHPNGNRIVLAISGQAAVAMWIAASQQLRSDGVYAFANSTNAETGTIDTGISRGSAGTVNFGNGTAGDGSGVVNAAAAIFSSNLSMSSGGRIFWSTRAQIISPADGSLVVENNAQTIGSQLKADALPTVASGFGTSPSITAGSTALAGSVNVGTGGTATTGVIAFNGTAFPSAPFCTATPTTSNVVQRVASSTTQLTLNVTTAWTASDVIFWQCISSK